MLRIRYMEKVWWQRLDPRQRVAWLVGLGVVGGALIGVALGVLGPVLGLAAIVGTVGGLLVLRDMRWGLLAVIAVVVWLPFASLPVKVVFTPTFLDLLLGVVYLVWVLRIATGKQSDLIFTPVGFGVGVYVLMAVFAFVAGLRYSSPTPNKVRTFAELLMGMGMFYLVLNTVRTRKGLELLVGGLILMGGVEAAVGIVLYVLPREWSITLLSTLGRVGYPTGSGVLRYIRDDPELPMRAVGTNVDPNILGALLVLVGTLAVTELVAREPILPRRLLAVIALLVGVCLFLTYSRGSMVGLVSALGLLALIKYRRLVPYLLLAALLVLLLPQTQGYVEHFVQGLRGEDLSTQMRFGEYKDALRLIQRYPWIGVGFAGTPDVDLYLAVASIYLMIAGAMGILGLLVFLVAMGVFLGYTLRAWLRYRRVCVREDDRLEAVLLGLAMAVVGALVSGVFDHTFVSYPHAVVLFWVVMGLGTVAARLAWGTEALGDEGGGEV